MKADAVPLLDLFEKKMRLEVPLFQRKYVWNRDDQWEPLWEDIERKFRESITGRADAPVHFLGAMVLDQKQTPVTHVEKRQVVDGQQRLTTLQIFLAAFRDYCGTAGFADIADECRRHTVNEGMVADPEVDRFKVWPTQVDRAQFKDVMTAGSRAELEKKHPRTRKKYARKDDPRPQMVEAYLYFSDVLSEFFEEFELVDGDVGAPEGMRDRLELAFRALRSSLHVVTIDLDGVDDPQVIFETLNARGEPLLPADLLRNYVFLRAARSGEEQDALYERYWSGFDQEFWREEVRQGRLLRPRADLFMQHFLAARTFEDVPAKHLFVEYKFWINSGNPFASVEEEMESLSSQREEFRRLIDPNPDDPVFDLAVFLERFDVRTAYPLLLTFLSQGPGEDEVARVGEIFESFLVRRTVCRLDTKAYNRFFLQIARALRNDLITSERLSEYMAGSKGLSAQWPSDDAFQKAWMTDNAYYLSNPRLTHIFTRLNETFTTRFHEAIAIDGKLTVEHLMPQKWEEHWPLRSGEATPTWSERWDLDDDDPIKLECGERESALQTMGNLTVITQELNSSVSNGPWEAKREALRSGTLLPINQTVIDMETWDESAIRDRGAELFSRALELWPRPRVSP